jgi:hypothetical protein
VELVSALANIALYNAVPLINMVVSILPLPSPVATTALTKHLLSLVATGTAVIIG